VEALPLRLVSAFLVLSLLPVALCVRVEPSSLSYELNPNENATGSVTLYAENTALPDVGVFIVGDSYDSDVTLKQMVSVYPTYVDNIPENSSKKFDLRISAVCSPGTYTGLIRFSSARISVPISVKVKGATVSTLGLVPDKGTFKITMPANKTLEKAFNVYNLSGERLVAFSADTFETEIYDSMDWVQVEYEAPYVFEPNRYVTVKVTVNTTGVPAGRHQRTVVLNAMTENGRKLEAAVVFDIMISGVAGVPENERLTIDVPSDIPEGGTLSIRVTRGGSPVANADIYIDNLRVGSTSEVGILSTTVTGPGVHTVKAKSGSAEESKTFKVLRRVLVTVNVASAVRVGSKITGTVVAEGQPLAGAVVQMGGRTAMTDQSGSFTLSTEGLTEGDYTLSVSKKGDLEQYYGSAQVTVQPGFPWMYVVLMVVLVVLIVVLVKKREKIGGLFRFFSAGPPVPK
jgi:hypothetical protein